MKFDVLTGKTILSADGLHDGSERVVFKCEDGSSFCMYHDQDCCETVEIYDLDGDAADILGSPVLLAEEVSDDNFNPPNAVWDDSYTWTFYKLRTAKGSLTIRWLGQSNGFYSESVDFYQLEDQSS